MPEKLSAKYPHNWPKVSRIIRRVAAGRCEWCHTECSTLSVHHIGTRWATGSGWKNGTSCDKHDVRRENLVALCWSCHSAADAPTREKIQAKRAQHAALGVGSGLILYHTPDLALAS